MSRHADAVPWRHVRGVCEFSYNNFSFSSSQEVYWKKLMNIIINCLAFPSRLDFYLVVGARQEGG